MNDACIGHVYLIWAEGTPRYKLGRSVDPSKRIEKLNQQSCYPLKLLHYCYFSDSLLHEARVHRVANRFRKHGEWFELPDMMVRHPEVWIDDPFCQSFTQILYKTVGTDLERVRACITLLGQWGKGTVLKPSTKQKVLDLFGSLPATPEEARAWKTELKGLIASIERVANHA